MKLSRLFLVLCLVALASVSFISCGSDDPIYDPVVDPVVDPVDIGGYCTSSAQCGVGNVCQNGTCVGDGNPRFVLEWDTAGDLDIHVRTPDGSDIDWTNTSADNGTLDVSDVDGGLNSVENVYFTPGLATSGQYEYWAFNYSGTTQCYRLKVYNNGV